MWPIESERVSDNNKIGIDEVIKVHDNIVVGLTLLMFDNIPLGTIFTTK